MKLTLIGVLIGALLATGCAGRRHKVQLVSMIHPAFAERIEPAPTEPSVMNPPETLTEPAPIPVPAAEPAPVPKPKPVMVRARPTLKKQARAKPATRKRAAKPQPASDTPPREALAPAPPAPTPAQPDSETKIPAGLLVAVPLAAAGLWLAARKLGEAMT